VRFRLSRPLGGIVRNATIAKDALGWHVPFGVATATRPAPPNRLPGCGVDFGVACSAFVSDVREPRLMPSTLTAGQRRRLLGLERRKNRQITWAKSTTVAATQTGWAAPSTRSPSFGRGRRAAGRTSSTS
jgi:putative transposase